MAALIKFFYTNYRRVMDDLCDPRVEDLPLMSSPWPTILLLVVYNLYVKKIGPSIMEKRKPFDLKYTMIIYNLVQIACNGFFVHQALTIVWFPGVYSLSCAEPDYSDDPIAVRISYYTWLFFVTKVLDLLDTVFMVLRKKQNQVTFLHLYHHTAMVAATWTNTKFIGGGHPIFLGTVNAFVHVVMYTYYLVTALYPEYKKNIWWKKHITELQLAQFVVTTLHAIIGLLNPDCNYPKPILAFFIPQDIFMFVMFWDFYKKAYFRRTVEADPKSSASKLTSNNVKED